MLINLINESSNVLLAYLNSMLNLYFIGWLNFVGFAAQLWIVIGIIVFSEWNFVGDQTQIIGTFQSCQQISMLFLTQSGPRVWFNLSTQQKKDSIISGTKLSQSNQNLPLLYGVK